ncbi:MAG: YggS family pyridoxal phosphate-dependent enzyme [Flavobacteriaceae bacterium]|jgi:PLP dependent protein|nr:YggS family pyridoxal phosphate-dependent enzyme [Flavobacteriaceae bacterium]
MNIKTRIKETLNSIPKYVDLVAISKTKSSEEIIQAYDEGQRIFGENKVQEMTEKQQILPSDIKWHMVGHLQRNKVKYIASYVSLIHSVDSMKLIIEINKQANKNQRIIPCLLQIKIAGETTKFGLSEDDATQLLENSIKYKNIKINGLMGMASLTKNELQIHNEFKKLKNFFDQLKSKFNQLKILSMGMSSDYKLAIKNGSNMIRIGSQIFGPRN